MPGGRYSLSSYYYAHLRQALAGRSADWFRFAPSGVLSVLPALLLALPKSAFADFEPRQEVAQQLFSFAGADRLGMELHALNRVVAMPQSHNLAFGGPRTDFETFRQTLWLDQQRMVAHRLEWVREPGENRFAVMHYRRGLAMHQP